MAAGIARMPLQWGQLLPGQRHGPAAMAATLASQEAWLSPNRAASMGWEVVEFGPAQNEGLEAELCGKDSSLCSHPKALRTGKQSSTAYWVAKALALP